VDDTVEDKSANVPILASYGGGAVIALKCSLATPI